MSSVSTRTPWMRDGSILDPSGAKRNTGHLNSKTQGFAPPPSHAPCTSRTSLGHAHTPTGKATCAASPHVRGARPTRSRDPSSRLLHHAPCTTLSAKQKGAPLRGRPFALRSTSTKSHKHTESTQRCLSAATQSVSTMHPCTEPSQRWYVITTRSLVSGVLLPLKDAALVTAS